MISKLGYQVAGFSINADDGAKLPKQRILKRLSRVRSGDIIIAHMNRPDSDTAEGLQVLLDQGFSFLTLRDAGVRYTSETAWLLARRMQP